MAVSRLLGVYFLVTFMTLVSRVHLLVPPKTPVLAGFEPAAIGSNRELVCDAYQTGAGTITYKWFKYSTNWESKGTIGTSQKYIFNPVTEKRVFHQGGNPEVVSGKYKCRASNTAGTRDSEWGYLYVYKPCSLYTVSVSPKPAVARTFTVNCYIPNPSGFLVTWTKKSDASSGANKIARANWLGCHPPTISRYSWSSCSRPSPTSRTFNLKVTNAATSDSGYWICTDAGLTCHSNPVKIIVQAPPAIAQITGVPSGPVLAGKQLNLKCVAIPNGDTYDWYKDNIKISTSLTYDFLVKKESAGVYKCVARNAGGPAASNDKTLTVYYPPSVSLSTKPKTVREGDDVTLTCEASGGNPTTYSYSWYYNNKEIQNEKSRTYEVRAVRYTQTGPYRCQVVNYSPGGVADATLNLDILYKPKWNPNVPKIATVARQPSESMTFVLHVIANPPPTNVSWVDKHNKPATEKGFSASKVNDRTYALSKKAVTVSDYGEYSANVTNDVGTSVFLFKLQESGPPHSPCCLSAVNVTAVSITLTFKSGFSGGSVQTFTIQLKGNHEAWSVIAKDIPDPGFSKSVIQRISKLSSNTSYEFRVKSVNSDGSSDYGDILQVKTRAAPVIMLSVERQGTRITARWDPFHHSYTKIQIKYCRKDDLDTCGYHIVTNQTAGETSFLIKGSAMVKSVLVLYFVVFDGPDIVYYSPTIVIKSPEGGPNIGIIVGVTVTVVMVIVVVIVVVIVLRRRNRACFAGKDEGQKQGQSVQGQNNPTGNQEGRAPVYVNVNPAFEAGETTSHGENEAHYLHPGNKEHEYVNVTLKDKAAVSTSQGKNEVHVHHLLPGNKQPEYVNVTPTVKAEDRRRNDSTSERRDYVPVVIYDDTAMTGPPPSRRNEVDHTNVRNPYADPYDVPDNPYAV